MGGKPRKPLVSQGLIDQIIQLTTKVEGLRRATDALEGYPIDDWPHPPRAARPASRSDLAQLNATLAKRGLSLPPSYRDFLCVCNGIEHFDPGSDAGVFLLGTGELQKPASEFHKRLFPKLSRFQFARGNGLGFMAFDPESATNTGEMDVVEVTEHGEQHRYGHFDVFLREHRSRLREELAHDKAQLKK